MIKIIWQVCFTLSLLLLWLFLLAIYFSLVPPRGPRQYGHNLTPGLSFRPRSQDPYSTLIHFRHGGSGNWQPLMASIKELTKLYSKGKYAGGSLKCNYNTHIGTDERCGVGTKKWIDTSYDTPCTGPEKYGMYHGQPCIAIKINKVFGWEPEPYYNITEVENHPKMPIQLKEKIHFTWSKHCKGKGEEMEKRCPQLRFIWVSCGGVTQADIEWLGPIHYTPWQGFPGFYFPYHNQDNYLSPVVWIQLRKITPGVLIQIRCKIWAQNIAHDDRNPLLGGLHMELMMD